MPWCRTVREGKIQVILRRQIPDQAGVWLNPRDLEGVMSRPLRSSLCVSLVLACAPATVVLLVAFGEGSNHSKRASATIHVLYS